MGFIPSLPSGDQRFIAERCVRRDRGNDKLERHDVFAYIQELKQSIYKKQAKDHFDRTLKKNNSIIVKSKIIAAQATTTQQKDIMVAQQYFWHKCVDSAINFLRSENIGGGSYSKKLATGDQQGLLLGFGFFMSDILQQKTSKQKMV